MTRNRHGTRYFRKEGIPKNKQKNQIIATIPPELILQDFIPSIHRLQDLERLRVYKEVIDKILGFIKNSRQVNYSKKDCSICNNKLVGLVYNLPCCNKSIRLECYIKSLFKCPFCRNSEKMTITRPNEEQLYNMIL